MLFCGVVLLVYIGLGWAKGYLTIRGLKRNPILCISVLAIVSPVMGVLLGLSTRAIDLSLGYYPLGWFCLASYVASVLVAMWWYLDGGDRWRKRARLWLETVQEKARSLVPVREPIPMPVGA